MNFFHKYYVPSNIVITVVGDIKARAPMPVIEKYFNRLAAAPAPEPLATKEPPQKLCARFVLHEQSQPVYIEGYHRPDYTDPDDASTICFPTSCPKDAPRASIARWSVTAISPSTPKAAASPATNTRTSFSSSLCRPKAIPPRNWPPHS